MLVYLQFHYRYARINDTIYFYFYFYCYFSRTATPPLDIYGQLGFNSRVEERFALYSASSATFKLLKP